MTPPINCSVPVSPLKKESPPPPSSDFAFGSEVMLHTAVLREPCETSGSHGHGSAASATPSLSESGHPNSSFAVEVPGSFGQASG